MSRLLKPIAVLGLGVGGWIAKNYLWQLLFSSGLGAAVSILVTPLLDLHGLRLYGFGAALAVALMGAVLYGVQFLPDAPLPPDEKEAVSRARVDEENFRQALPPFRGELEHNREILERALEWGQFWSYADGERLESDQWNNRKHNLKVDRDRRDFWLANGTCPPGVQQSEPSSDQGGRKPD